jgi:hypothetical protein
MTRFNPEKNNKSPEEWSAVALKATQENHLQWNVIGGIVLGALAASTASPITGGLVAAYFLWDSWKKAGDIQRNQTAVAELGCVAQVLDGDDFADYIRQVGKDAVIQELKFASERKLALSDAAADFYEDWQEAKVIPQQQFAPTQQQALIGTQSRTVTDVYDGGNKIDIIGSMTDRVSNSLILGIAGTGKGMLVSNASRVAKSKHPKLRIFYVDPKDDKKEYGYTEGVADVVKRYKCESESPEIVVKWLKSVFEEFDKYAIANDAQGYRTLLILDEGTVLGLKSKLAKSTILIDRLSSLTSLGDSSGKNVWFICQTPFVGGSGIDLSASSQLVTIALVSAENLGALRQWKKSAMFTQPPNLEELINKYECKRAVYFGKTGQWYSMPKLTNYSGYDRDNRTSTTDDKVTNKFQSETVVTQLEKLFNREVQIDNEPLYTEEFLNQILFIIRQSEKTKMSFTAIRVSKIWAREWDISHPSTTDLRAGLLELIKREKITGDEEDGYGLTNNIS